MALLPIEKPEIVINDLIENREIPQNNRSYIGYSGLGGKCKRKIWYDFRWVKDRTISRRIDRLFKRGDWEEGRIVEDLESIGVVFHSEQKEVVGIAKHVLGHIDGLLDSVPGFNETILAEFKTANDKFFKLFKKNGVRKTNETYYYQAISYMGRLGLKRCLFIVTNKNDEQRYIEVIEFNQDDYDMIESIALEILTTDVPPERVGGKTWFDCKYCDYYLLCQFDGEINNNCRTCVNGTIEDDGVWSCDGNEKLDIEKQKIGCNNYKMLGDIRK